MSGEVSGSSGSQDAQNIGQSSEDQFKSQPAGLKASAGVSSVLGAFVSAVIAPMLAANKQL